MNKLKFLQLAVWAVAALGAVGTSPAASTNVIVSARAMIEYSTPTLVGAQTNQAYLKVKYTTASACAKTYLEFDLTGKNPNTNATARVIWRTISSSGAQRLQLWALNQSFAGDLNAITWNDAPANVPALNTDTNVPLFATNGPPSATLLSEANYGSGVTRPSTDLPANWGQFIQGNKLVIAIASPTNVVNSVNGYRIDFTNSVPTNWPMLFFSDLSGGLPPTITTTTNQTVYEYHPVVPVTYFVDDADSGAAAVQLSAVSDNTNVVPNNFSFTTVNATNRTLNFTVGAAGSAEVRVWASDGVLSNSTAFTVTVLPDPAISAPGGTNTLIGVAATGSYIVSDVDLPAASLTTSAKSLDLGVVLDGSITTGGSGSNRTVTATPTVGDGVGTIQVSVSDGVHSNSTIFAVMALPGAGTYFSDHFSYPNAAGQDYSSLQEVSGGFWAQRSSGSTFLRVSNSAALIRSSSAGQSLIGPLSGGPYTSGVIYYGFRATWLSMPAHSDADFIHLYDSTGLYRVARVGTETNGTATDSFLLTFGNITTSVDDTNVLTTNVTYTVIVSYDVSVASTRLWVNPTSESSPYAEAFDISTGGLPISHVGLRQNLGMGSILIDDLKVASSFAEVVPPPVTTPVIQSSTYTAGTFKINFTGAVSDSPSSFKLLTATDVAGPYAVSGSASFTRLGTNLFQATHVTGAAQRFYRIQR